MPYLLMALSVTLAVANSALLHKFANKGLDTAGDVFLFNAAISGVWFLILLFWSLLAGGPVFSGVSLLFGSIYGLLLCAFLYLKMQSMATGPVSLTSLIGCAAFIIVVVYGVLFRQEYPTACQIVGILGLIAALVLCTFVPHGDRPKRCWYIYCLLFLLAGGGVGILYKLFGEKSADVNEMMLTASFVSSLLFALLAYTVNGARKQRRPHVPAAAFRYVLLCGVTSCLYIRLNISLTPKIPSAIFFPVSNGAIVMLSVLVGSLLFHEKLRPAQKLGFVIGLLAIILNGCGDALISLFVS